MRPNCAPLRRAVRQGRRRYIGEGKGYDEVLDAFVARASDARPCWRRRSIAASTAWRGSCRTPSAHGRSAARGHSCAVRWSRRADARRLAAARGAARATMRSRPSWTMSSATSTDDPALTRPRTARQMTPGFARGSSSCSPACCRRPASSRRDRPVAGLDHRSQPDGRRREPRRAWRLSRARAAGRARSC